MITYLELRNWRAFDKVALHLDAGTSFIVAENGIGKTSILRGAAWAIFGPDHIDPVPELRVNRGATDAVGIVALTTSSGELEIERVHRVGRGARPSITATLAGREIDPDELPRTLNRVLGAHPSVAAQLGFVHQHALVSDRTLFTGVKGFLRQLTGVSRLDVGRSALLKTQKALDRRAAALNKQAKARGSEIDSLKSDRVQATAALNRAEAGLAKAQEQHDAAHAAAALFEQWKTYRDSLASYEAARAELLDEIAGFSAVDELARTLAELQSTSRDLGQLIAQAQATADLHRQLEAQLAGEPTCPVCRQSIDDEQAQRATSHHRDAIDDATRTNKKLATELATTSVRIERIADLKKQFEELIEPIAPVNPEPAASEMLDIEATESARVAAQSRVHACQAELAAVGRSLAAARSDTSAYDELVHTRRLEAVAVAAGDVLDRSIKHHVTTRIDPLSNALTRGWGQFFTDEESLVLTDEGEVCMRLNDGTTLAYPQLSGGQQALAILTLRLALIAGATTLGTAWLDEPLEHLDPLNRRRAANLLSQASREALTQQIVATTYEEEIARRLAAQHDHVHLHYVRSD